jgi:hypothetical protein
LCYDEGRSQKPFFDKNTSHIPCWVSLRSTQPTKKLTRDRATPIKKILIRRLG